MVCSCGATPSMIWAVGDRVVQAVLCDGCGHDPEELMVPADAGQVALALLRPVGGIGGGDPRPLVLEVAGAHHLEGVVPVEMDASRGLLVEIRVGVVDRLGEVHADPAQCIHHVGEGVEVELDVVLDGDAEVLLDGGDHLLGTLVEGGVDLVGSLLAGVRDEEIPGDRKDGDGVGGGVEVEDHHDVAVHPVHALGAEPVGRVLDLERASVGGSDQQDVLGPGICTGARRHGQSPHVDPVDLRIEEVAVARLLLRPGPPARRGRSR